jgi:hypothetical protein
VAKDTYGSDERELHNGYRPFRRGYSHLSRWLKTLMEMAKGGSEMAGLIHEVAAGMYKRGQR